MKQINIDIETYSSVDLSKSGVYKYAEDKEFEILLFGYSVDMGDVQVIDLAMGEQIPDEIIEGLKDDNVLKYAFNAQFERVCISNYLELYLKPDSWRCTMVASLYLGLPGSLAAVGKVLSLDKQKLDEGKELIKYFSVPCKATKSNGGRTRNMPRDNIEKWRLFKAYNKRDVETEMEILKRVSKFPVPDFVWKQYSLDQRINDTGIKLDETLVNGAIKCNEESRNNYLNRASQLTGLENPNSPIQLKEWLISKGVEVETLTKAEVKKLMETCSGEVLEVLRLRQLLSKSSVKKYEAMKNCKCKDERAHGLLQFYGASRTGRWSGKIIQVQNLPQNHIPDLEVARELVKNENIEAIELLYDSLPDVLSQLIRTAFIPKEGCKFIVADFSAIEARVIAWLAGEKWRMDVFKDNGDIYCASASQMFKVPVEKHGVNSHLRQKGKVAELACIAEGSLVLTDKGLVPIEKITKKHLLWDGIEWVKHDGVVYKGIKEVIDYDGLKATRNHKVWIEGKKKPVYFGEAAKSRSHLIQTGYGRKEIWYGDNYFSGKEMEQELESLLCINKMQWLWKYPMATIKQLNKWKIKRVPKLFSTIKSSQMANQKTGSSKTKMRKCKFKTIQELWRTRNKILLFKCFRSRTLDTGKCIKCETRIRTGQDRQQRKLRSWQYSICREENKSGKQKNKRNSLFQTRRMAVFKGNSDKNDFKWNEKRRNNKICRKSSARKKKELEINTSKARVYDILNAGPRQRFTVSGKLVHNCGYGGSVGALKAMGAIEMGVPEEELKNLITDWRKSNPSIVKLWWDVDKAVIKAIKERKVIKYKCLSFQYVSGILFIKLPSGRSLSYVKPRIEPNVYGRDSVTYEGIGTGKRWERIESYGPKFVENIIQAISRDILAEAMDRLSKAGYKIVMHVHDECVIEASINASLEDACKIMSETPSWTPGLILNAAGYECKFYQKD